jgi:hypothetical protein
MRTDACPATARLAVDPWTPDHTGLKADRAQTVLSGALSAVPDATELEDTGVRPLFYQSHRDRAKSASPSADEDMKHAPRRLAGPV